MPWGLGAYHGGTEILFSASPYNLAWCVRLVNCKPGTYSFTVPDNGVGGVLSWVFGLDRMQPNETIDLGGSTTNRVTVQSLDISGRTITLVLVADGFGLKTLDYSFYFSR